MQILLTGKASIYDEIVDSIKKYIAIGALKEGEKLPSVRELALSLSVNPNTVARAYEVLCEQGYLISLPKKGCFVAPKKKDEHGLAEEVFKSVASLYPKHLVMFAVYPENLKAMRAYDRYGYSNAGIYPFEYGEKVRCYLYYKRYS